MLLSCQAEGRVRQTVLQDEDLTWNSVVLVSSWRSSRITMSCDCQRIDTELTFVLHGASQRVDVLELLACILCNIVTILRSRLS
jgi:hypothetical protein